MPPERPAADPVSLFLSLLYTVLMFLLPWLLIVVAIWVYQLRQAVQRLETRLDRLEVEVEEDGAGG